MSLGVLDLWVIGCKVGDDLVLHPRRWRSATGSPVVGGRQRAAYCGHDVPRAVLLDAGAEAGLTFVRGHGVMLADFSGIAMPKFWGGSRDVVRVGTVH